MRHIPLPIQSMADLDRYGQVLAQSGVFGEINPAVGLIIATHLYQTNTTPIEFAANYDIVSGHPTRKAKSLLAELVAKGGSYSIDVYTDTEVAITISFGSLTRRFATTIKDAEAANLTRDNKGRVKTMWLRFPRRMLFARTVSEGVGVVAPGVNAGLYTPEEVSDFDGNDTPLDDAESIPAAAPSAQPAQPQPAPTPDPTICSLECPYKGQKWEQLDDSLLDAALAYDGVPADAKEYIRTVVAARKNANRKPAPQEAS